MTAKEDCFEEASNAYSKEKGDLGLEHKTTWRQNQNDTWERDPGGFWPAVNSMRKWLNGLGHERSVQQVRVPDVTISTPKGPLVIDLKFTRADKSVDKWGTTFGKGNGRLQRDDYNAINAQTDPNAQDLKLDPDSCNCKVRGAEQEVVHVPVAELEGSAFFVPVLGEVPVTVPGAIRIPIPQGLIIPGITPIFP